MHDDTPPLDPQQPAAPPPTGEADPREAYEAPRLIDAGDVSEITRTGANTGADNSYS